MVVVVAANVRIDLAAVQQVVDAKTCYLQSMPVNGGGGRL